MPFNAVSTNSLHLNLPAAPPTFQPALDDLLQPQPPMIIPSQQTLATLSKDLRRSVKELTPTNQPLTVAPWMTQLPHPTTFVASSDDFAQHEVGTLAPPLLYPVHDLHIDEASPPPTSRISDGCTPSDTQQNYHSQSLLPTTKKQTSRVKSKLPKRLASCLSPVPASRVLAMNTKIACLFCRNRKIACRPPALLGNPDRTCR